jgi:hypothetical protein
MSSPDGPRERPLDEEALYIYSAEDFGNILADAFVELRELTDDDETAAEAVDIVYDRLTDDFYTSNDRR